MKCALCGGHMECTRQEEHADVYACSDCGTECHTVVDSDGTGEDEEEVWA